MSSDTIQPHVIASGDKVLLRDGPPSDVDRYVHWQTHGK